MHANPSFEFVNHMQPGQFLCCSFMYKKVLKFLSQLFHEASLSVSHTMAMLILFIVFLESCFSPNANAIHMHANANSVHMNCFKFIGTKCD